MKARNWLLAIGAVALVALASDLYREQGRGRLCEYLGGRWAYADQVCTTRDCYAHGDCGYWSNPALRCARLNAGDPIAEVYFQLGNPDTVHQTRYQWRNRKGYGIDAVIERGGLKTLDCRVGQPGP
jgi:hypothetical protein